MVTWLSTTNLWKEHTIVNQLLKSVELHRWIKLVHTAPLNDSPSLNGQGITGTESLTYVHTWTLISGSLVLYYSLVQTGNQWPFSTCLSRFRHCTQSLPFCHLACVGNGKILPDRAVFWGKSCLNHNDHKVRLQIWNQLRELPPHPCMTTNDTNTPSRRNSYTSNSADYKYSNS